MVLVCVSWVRSNAKRKQDDSTSIETERFAGYLDRGEKKKKERGREREREREGERKEEEESSRSVSVHGDSGVLEFHVNGEPTASCAADNNFTGRARVSRMKVSSPRPCGL